ncbi:MAG: type II toxin-antitoxin system VapC family toxin [Bryobacteraceae bacterium]
MAARTTLVDTSVRVEHFRQGVPELAEALNEGWVLMHPVVAGELACGNLKNRYSVLEMLDALPCARVATHAEVRMMLDTHRLCGPGLGLIDVNLLTSAALTQCRLRTLDKNLHEAASGLGLT